MSEEYNKFNAELKKVDGELFATEEFASAKPVPLDSAIITEGSQPLKPLPASEENLTPVAEGFIPVREDSASRPKEEIRESRNLPPAIKTFSDTRPLNASVFDAPLKPLETVPKVMEKGLSSETIAAVASSASSIQPQAVAPAGIHEMPVHPLSNDSRNDALPPVVSPAAVAEEPVRRVITEEKPAAVAEEPVRRVITEEKPAAVAEESRKTTSPRMERSMPKSHTAMPLPDAEGSLGSILRTARNLNGMTVEEVADITKIRLDYIIALENDDIKRLPPVVFIRAYTRTIAQVYKLDKNVMDLLMEKVKALEPPADVPEQLLQKLEKDVQVSEEETKKVKMIVYYSIAVIALIISLVITSIVAATISRSRTAAASAPEIIQKLPGKETSAAQPFPDQDLEKLLPQQLPELKVLEVPTSRKESIPNQLPGDKTPKNELPRCRAYGVSG